MSSKGKIIVIDGIDGTGKATQTAKLKERLEKEGKKVVTIDFPQYEDNVMGRILRRALRGEFGDFLALEPQVASLLYAADRRESLPKIQAWIDEGYIIIIDRFVSSNMIHQGGKISDEEKAKEFLAWLDDLEHGLVGLPRPEAIVYLDVTAEIARDLLRKRAEKEGGERDKVEGELEHMIASRNRALSIVGNLNNWIPINCSDGNNGILPVEDIHEMICEKIVGII